MMPAYMYFSNCNGHAIGICLIFWGLTPPNKWNQPWFEHSYTKLLSYIAIMAKYPGLSIKWCLVYIIYTFSLSSPSMWDSVLPRRTHKHFSFSAGIPAMQVCLHVCHLSGTSCTPRASYSLAPHAEGSLLTCEQGCNVACETQLCFLDPHVLSVPLQRCYYW